MGDKKKKGETKEEYYIRIGPLLKEVLDIQKKKIKEATWDVVESSEYNAGEIVAKKVKEYL